MLIFFFLLGTIIGSFLNVCALRIPRGLNFTTDRSHCPNCGKDLIWWQLIPVLSFVFLRAKCAHCGVKISWRYPIVELATGLIYVLIYEKLGLDYAVIPAMVFAGILIVVTLIDLDYKIIPNKVVLFGLAAGIPLNLLVGKPLWHDMLIGAMSGSLLLLVIALISKGGMGGGDIKFTAMLGIYLGWVYTLETIFLASILGAAVGLCLMLIGKANRKTALPFGPFLAIGAFVLYFWGSPINYWYWHLHM